MNLNREFFNSFFVIVSFDMVHFGHANALRQVLYYYSEKYAKSSNYWNIY